MLSTALERQLPSPLPLLALASLLHLLYRRLARYLFSRRSGCRAPASRAPVRDPIVGLDFAYDAVFGPPEERHLEASLAAFRRLGPTYTVQRWAWEVLYTCDSRNIKHLLAGGFGDFALPSLRVSAVGSLLGRGIFTLNGPSWARARAALKPRFARLDRPAVVGALERHLEAMLGLVPDGVVVDLQSLFFRLTMDFAGDFLMGNGASTTLGRPVTAAAAATTAAEADAAATAAATAATTVAAERSRAERFVDDYMTCSQEVVKRLRLGPLQHLRFSMAAWRAKRNVFRYMDDFIDEALRQSAGGGSGGGSMLAELAAATSDRRLLRDQVLHILVASRDTTASVLSNLFFVLARHPSAYRRLRADVLAVAGGDAPPTAAQLKQMEYLRWCVNESLRLHPVIPTNAREATRDTTLPHGGGVDGASPLLVPKGVVVMYNVYALHRDERVFGSRPDAFEPERWRDRRPGWGFLPFSGGPRICMGQQLALVEVQYVVARMAQTFDTIESHGERDWVGLDALATTCRDGVKVSLKRA